MQRPWPEALRLVGRVAEGLHHAHQHGIVHRDVKPGNIMLVQDTLTVKVADFGICRIMESDTKRQAQQTQMGDVIGTPHYMSPEKVLGMAVDARSDLFSAGVVLYQLVAGALPFDGDSLIYQGTVLVDADPARIYACLNVPDPGGESRLTTLRTLLGGTAPPFAQVYQAVL